MKMGVDRVLIQSEKMTGLSRPAIQCTQHRFPRTEQVMLVSQRLCLSGPKIKFVKTNNECIFTVVSCLIVY